MEIVATLIKNMNAEREADFLNTKHDVLLMLHRANRPIDARLSGITRCQALIEIPRVAL